MTSVVEITTETDQDDRVTFRVESEDAHLDVNIAMAIMAMDAVLVGGSITLALEVLGQVIEFSRDREPSKKLRDAMDVIWTIHQKDREP